jgi:hypothetical protein
VEAVVRRFAEERIRPRAGRARDGPPGEPRRALRFDGVEPPEAALWGPEGSGCRLATSALDEGRIGIGAHSVGFARAALEAALGRGAARLGRTLPAALAVAVPFYGDTLDDFTRAHDLPLTTDIKTRGGRFAAEFLEFQAAVADALRRRAGIADAEVEAEDGPDPRERGPPNWAWVQAIFRALAEKIPGLSQRVLEAFTRDVFLYVRRAGVRDEIDRILGQALDERPAVVVGHSLGSVVAFNVRRSDRRRLVVPLLVTAGSPRGIRAIRDELRPLRFPQGVEVWRNAFDERDPVALYPLDEADFPVSPPIENHSRGNDTTENRHGAAGCLDDPVVAGWSSTRFRGEPAAPRLLHKAGGSG